MTSTIERSATPDGPGKPEVADPRPWPFPTATSSTTRAGTPVYVIDCPGQYVATVRVLLDLPLAAEPREQEGVATLLSRTMDEGTEVRDGEAFAAALEREGAAYGVDVSSDSLGVEVSVPISHLGPAVELLAEAVTRPAFADNDVRRHVAIRLGEIPQEHANPGYLARETLAAQLYDPGLRRSRPAGGTADTVGTVDAAAVRALYESHIGPSRATIVFAGATAGIDPAAVIDAAFGDWSADPSGTSPEQTPAYRPGRRIVVVDRPGSVQSQLLLGAPGPDRHDPDWAVAAVANQVVCGSITSRVDRVLREEKGYTYGTRGAFTAPRRGGTFTLGGSVRTEVTAPAVDEALRILLEARDGLTDDEVAEARQNLIRVAPLRYEQADSIAAQAAANLSNGVGIDFVDGYLRGIAETTAEQASAAYRRFVTADDLLVVVVGDASQIVEPLRALGRGDVDVIG